MHRNGTFNLNHKTSKEKGMAAVEKVLEILKKSGVPPLSTQFQLFKSIARASLLYGSPDWAIKHYKDLDKLQNHFLRRILRLPSTAPDYFIRMETGCQDTRVQFLSDTIGFWERIFAKNEESPAKQCMLTQIEWTQTNTIDMQRKYCWAEDFFSLLKKAKCQQIPTSCSSLISYRKSLIINFELELKNQDVIRMVNSTFNPVYQFI